MSLLGKGLLGAMHVLGSRIPSAGIRLLPQLRIQLPVQASCQLLPLNLPGWSLAQLLPGGAQSKQKRIPFHPAVDRALRYARVALLKRLGLLPEAMLFAQLLAKQQSSCPSQCCP